MPFPLPARVNRKLTTWLLLAGALVAIPVAIWAAAAPAAPTAASAAATPQAKADTTRPDNSLITNKAPAMAGSTLPTEGKRFAASRTLSLEANVLIRNLEEIHYNRGAVKQADYAQVIPNYMGDSMGGLDRQHLFFLASDRAKFMNDYAATLYFNVKNSGNLASAYEIFYVYRKRLADRIAWINEALKGDFTFDTNETYETDRTDSKTPWPANAAAADALWKLRLKWELLDEVLAAKKAPAVALKDSPPTGSIVDALGIPAASAPAIVPQTGPLVASATPAKSPLEQAKETIRKRYERQMKAVDEYDAEDVAERFLNTIAELYDPHSSYQSASSFDDFNIQMRLELVGIGAVLELSKDGDYCTIKEVVPGGPAALDNHLREGDRIVGVAQGDKGEPVEVIGWSLTKIVRLIRGDKDTKVRLSIWPAKETDSSVRREYVITRDKVKLNSTRAHGAIFDVPGPNGTTVPFGVITLPLFYGGQDDDDKRTASNDVKELIGQMKQSGIKGLALDLRRNGGGLLNEAIDLTGLFIRRGPVVQVKSYDGDVDLGVDRDNSIAYDGPLAVVVDRFSASASEIVAGALQNYGRAVIVGDSSTHGKGTVQTIQPFNSLIRSQDKLGAIKLTIQKFYLPNGSSTQLKGVIPDIVLPSVDEYIPNIGERDLDHALAWDEIPSAVFDRVVPGIDALTLAPLRKASLQRQQTLEEFSFLNTNIDRFKTRVEESKVVSLNLKKREEQKTADKSFNDQTKTERDRLAKNDFPYREFWLGEKPVPKAKSADDDPDDPEADPDDGAAYAKVDINLRETFRILTDYLNLSPAAQTKTSASPTTATPAPAPGGRG